MISARESPSRAGRFDRRHFSAVFTVPDQGAERLLLTTVPPVGREPGDRRDEHVVLGTRVERTVDALRAAGLTVIEEEA